MTKKDKIQGLLFAAATALMLLLLVGYIRARADANRASADSIPADAITCTGTARGLMGDVVVEVVADAEHLYSIEVVEHTETEGIGTVAAVDIPKAMFENQSLQVDAVAGATVTSEAVREAVRAALASAGIDAAPFEVAPAATGEAAEDQVVDCDVVIVGAGGAGMTAAIEAADAGSNVVIVESQAMVGGNSVRATGGLNAAETPAQDENEFDQAAGVEKTLQTAAETYADNEAITELAAVVREQWEAYQADPQGYFDSVELMELDTMIGGKGVNDPALVATLSENSAAAIEWLESIGASMPSVSSFGGASVMRIHRPVNAEGKTESVGAYMVPILQENLEQRGITVLLQTTAERILMDDAGNAVGIEATGSAGQTVTVNAKAVILATGGFGANLEMVTQYQPSLEGFMTTNAPGALGQGIAMAEQVGAATVDMEQIQIHPTVEYNTASLITEGLRGDGAILVNAEGQRFVDEVGTRDVVSAAEIAQPGGYAWLLFDQKMADASNVISNYIKKGYTVSGADAAELAAAMEVDADALAQTLEDWNGCVAAASDPQFGRTSFAAALDTAPYYAIKVTAGIHHTMGGLKIDTETQVLTADGTAIPGLYAAGEVTGGVHGANRLGGNAVADFTVFGRIAGQQAAEHAKAA